VDRCALFVDAGYVLADGAMAVHGTRRRESVSWDYEGLLKLLSDMAGERSGLPLLRCYWYEATVEGRRTADHNALADLPGVKLRLAKMRPGRREGVESEIHRDLTTLGRNQAVSDAIVVSAEEDLAQVVADVQDLGMRVTLVHIAVDGNWTISRTLRQECDDVAEITAAHLRPYVELISGAEPPREDEHDGALIALRPQANGHAAVTRQAPYLPAAGPADNGHQAPPDIYTAPVVAEYQRSAPRLSPPRREAPAASFDEPQPEEREPRQAVHQDLPARPEPQRIPEPQRMIRRDALPARQEILPARQETPSARQEIPAGRQEIPAASADIPAMPQDLPARRPDEEAARMDWQPRQDQLPARQDIQQARQDQQPARQDQQPMRQDLPARPEFTPRQDLYAAPVAVPPEPPSARPRAMPDPSGYNPGGIRDPWTPQAGEAAPAEGPQPAPHATGSAQIHRLPTRDSGMLARDSGIPQSTNAQPVLGQSPIDYTVSAPAEAAGPGGGPSVGPHSGAPAGPAVYQGGQPAVSLADAVQSAHEEGQEFGSSVAQEAPALWLEAVLARKPRMPSDLEARLLQGSTLPIDYLLHDEVRHALRRGFWDALERVRR
jgi:uncharacterized LabA/DUF88 family protein